MDPESAQRQMWFEFLEKLSVQKPSVPALSPRKMEPVETEKLSIVEPAGNVLKGRDAVLEENSRQWLSTLREPEGAAKVQVIWNARLRSTAGYARWPQWSVELNPRLVEFEGQVERTLKHELAHLIAYSRSGRRRIEPHGPEWRRACADLGIPDESARHTLPLPRSRQQKKFVYACPVCQMKVERVKRFKRHTACLPCCRKHNGGAFDARFQFVLVDRLDQ